MIVKCNKCSGNMVFDPKQMCLVCESCGSTECASVKPDPLGINHCQNCGGLIEEMRGKLSGFCENCGAPIIDDDALRSPMAPKYIIPFNISKMEAVEKFREKFKNVYLLPRDFIDSITEEKLEGTYIPYYFVDSNMEAEFDGTLTKTRTYKSGENTVKEVKYYRVVRELHMRYDNVPVSTSDYIEDKYKEYIEPFATTYEKRTDNTFNGKSDKGLLTDFHPMFMLGYFGEKMKKTFAEVKNIYKQKMTTFAKSSLKESLKGYDAVIFNNKNSNVNLNPEEEISGLVPIWKHVYRYKNKDFNFYINGQTGEVVGEPPIDKGNLILLGLQTMISRFCIIGGIYLIISLITNL